MKDSIKIQLNKIDLNNYRGFTHLNIDFDEKVNIIIGENGTGKSAIIDAISELLKIFINEVILNENYFKETINFYDIKNNTNTLYISAEFTIIYPKDIVSLYPNYLNQFNKKFKNFKQQFKKVIESYSFDLWQNIETFNANQYNPIKEFDLIIENLQNEEYDFNIEIINQIFELRQILDNSIPTENEIILNLTMELNKASDKPKYFWNDIGEFERLQYSFNQYEEWIDSFPLFLDFGSGYINIGSDQFSAVNKLFEKKHAIYRNAFTLERFSIEDFIIWFDSIYKLKLQNAIDTDEKYAQYKYKIVNYTICKALNVGKDLYSNLKMKYYKNRMELEIEKSDQYDKKYDLSVRQLSSGEKALLALVGDITRRVILANPIDSDGMNPEAYLKKASGIILIDELDLHLHPKWQRGILPILTELFPNIQFVITTHSPFVIQNIEFDKPSKLIVLQDTDEIKYKGRQIERILIDIFNVNKLRPEFITKKFKEIYRLIENDKIKEAEIMLNELKDKLTNNDDEIIAIETLLEYKKMFND